MFFFLCLFLCHTPLQTNGRDDIPKSPSLTNLFLPLLNRDTINTAKGINNENTTLVSLMLSLIKPRLNDNSIFFFLFNYLQDCFKKRKSYTTCTLNNTFVLYMKQIQIFFFTCRKRSDNIDRMYNHFILFNVTIFLF